MNKRRLLSGLLLLTILSAIAGCGQPAPKKLSPLELAKKYYVRPAFFIPQAVEGDYFAYGEAIHWYQQDHFTGALSQLELIEKDSERFLAAQYVSAHCFFLLEQYDNARIQFRFIYTSLQPVNLSAEWNGELRPVRNEQIQWDLCLTYLAQNNLEKANFWLEKIRKDVRHPYQKEAEEIYQLLAGRGGE